MKKFAVILKIIEGAEQFFKYLKITKVVASTAQHFLQEMKREFKEELVEAQTEVEEVKVENEG